MSFLKRFVFAVVASIVGYIVGAVGSYFLVEALSSNVHDRSVEAAMASAFVYGPLTAIVAFAATMIFGRSRRAPRA